MILDIKNMIKLLDLIEAFDKTTDLLSNPDNNEKTIYQLLDDFKSHGGVILGQGKYATVLFYPSWKYVLKIFSDDVPYLKFVRFCLKNPRKSFPIFYDKPRRIIPNYKRHKNNTFLYVVKTEKLFPINIREYDDILYYLEYDKEYAQEVFNSSPKTMENWKFIYNKLVSLEEKIPSLRQFKEDYNFLRFGPTIGSLDIHKGNIMKRENGEFVLSDPFWEGETPHQTYDRLLKAEIGYDDYENRDPELDMVKSGEKYKKPKPIKKSTFSTSKKSDEDIPF